MSGRWKRVAASMAIAALAIVGTAMAAHHVLPRAHRPDAAEFGFGPRRSADGRYVATLHPDGPLGIRKMLSVRLALTDTAGTVVDGATIHVRGGMPEHHHGLPTRPRVTRRLEDGTYRVDGLKFNMSGWWTLTFRIDAAAGRDSVTFNLDL